jgi:putative endonuclease
LWVGEESREGADGWQGEAPINSALPELLFPLDSSLGKNRLARNDSDTVRHVARTLPRWQNPHAMAPRVYFVYILASASGTLYTGITRYLERRVEEHKQKILPGFTREYDVTRLVFYEAWGDVRAAIGREKQIKSWRREKKLALVRSMNPAWRDLSDDWRKGG